MEGKGPQQKRMEHVFRLLSYVVKRVVEADKDGIVPFAAVADEPSLVDRVHGELQVLFPRLDIGRVEGEIANVLNTNAKGYLRTSGIADWLERVFFQFHCSLYKSRPIFWHIASSQGASPFAFGALVTTTVSTETTWRSSALNTCGTRSKHSDGRRPWLTMQD